MATRSTDAATTQTSPEPTGQGQTATDWTEQALLADAREQGVPGTGGPWRWFFSGIWLVYLIQPVADLFHHGGAVWIAGGIVITIAFCGIYLPVLMLCESRPRLALYGLGALAALAAVACLVYGKDWTPLWIYVSAAGGFVLTSAAAGPPSASSPSPAASCCSAGSPTSTWAPPWPSCCPSCSSAWP